MARVSGGLRCWPSWSCAAAWRCRGGGALHARGRPGRADNPQGCGVQGNALTPPGLRGAVERSDAPQGRVAQGESMDTVDSVVGALLRGSEAAALPAGSHEFFRATPQTPHVTVLFHGRLVTAARLAPPLKQFLSHRHPWRVSLARRPRSTRPTCHCCSRGFEVTAGTPRLSTVIKQTAQSTQPRTTGGLCLASIVFYRNTCRNFVVLYRTIACSPALRPQITAQDVMRLRTVQ